MSDRRKRIIGLAFAKMDKTDDGKITVEDLKGKTERLREECFCAIKLRNYYLLSHRSA